MKIELSLNFGKGGSPADAPDETPIRPRRPKHRRFRLAIIAAIVVVVIVAVGAAVYLHLSKKPATDDPFTAEVQSSVQFPLYYPTRLPAGYSIDPATVTEPKQGVILFRLKSRHGAAIYISEEARPESYNLGGFYKTFTSYKEVGMSDGSIASGFIGSGQTEIASRANNKTWVLATTVQKLPQDQLITMLRSLTVSY